MTGKMSIFGGPNDSGMLHEEGLALYEHAEANYRPDLFSSRSEDITEGTCKRLKPDAFYFAMRFPSNFKRTDYQVSAWILLNPKNGLRCVASMVDWGPSELTSRTFDVSPSVATALKLQTDDEIIVTECLHLS